MILARAGVVSISRGALYLFVAGAVAVLAAAVIVVPLGGDRFFTGVLVGAVLAVAIGIYLFGRDTVLLTDDGIVTRRPWSVSTTPWSAVLGGRFAIDDGGKWSLTLDLNAPAGAELPLLTIPPVRHTVVSPYEMRKRDQVREIVRVLRARDVPLTYVPEIETALHEHWKV